MLRPKPPVLRLEALEDRATPAIFGQPWLDGRHLTLSFAPDGTAVSGVGSNLSGLAAPFGSLAGAKLEVLRAFQTWAVNANLNIGIVGDNGAAFGTSRAIQNDPRFGDIRIGARALTGDVVAITAPFSLLTPNSGDLILNTAKSFAQGDVTGAYDLFTVLLQESGHAFGMSNSTDPASVMFEQYQGARAGLSAGDVTGMQGLYGARTPDAYEGTTGNETLATAGTFANGLEADLSTTADVDTYRYVATDAAARWFRIKAAGLSLVDAKLNVVDATGQVIGSGQATSPLQNDVTVYVPSLVSGATYYLQVSSARSDVFGIGSYRLVADTTQAGTPAPNPYALVNSGPDNDSTLATAATPARSTGAYDYSFRGSLNTATDVDVYRIHAPSTAGGMTKLNVSVAGVGGSWFQPHIDVYTAAGVLLTTTTVAQTDSSLVVSVDSIPAGVDYFVRVSSDFHQAGNYDFVGDFQPVMPVMKGARGTLTTAIPSTSATLYIWQSQTVQLNLLSNLTSGSDYVGRVRVYNSQNQVVFDLLTLTGVLSTGQVYLPRGAYRVDVGSLTAATINFNLTMFGTTDPEGTSPTDPTGNPASGGGAPLPPPPDPTTTVGITPTTTTTSTDPTAGTTMTTTTTTDATTGTQTTTTTMTTAAGATTTTTATLATDIVWF
jgi:hypothetical protein